MSVLTARAAKLWRLGHNVRCLSVDLSGVFPPIATPFNNDESIAYDKLSENVQRWERIPFRGYVVQGSNGEYPLLSMTERLEMVNRVKKLIPSNKLLIAGSGCESTAMTVELSNKMADAGADAVLVISPSYYKANMKLAELRNYYEDVASKSKVPVILYNMPANTGLDLSLELIAALAKHPNILALKDSGGDITKIARVLEKTRQDNFQVLAGSAGFFLPALMLGCVGTISGLANILGGEICQLHTLYKEGKLQEVVQLHLRIVTPNALRFIGIQLATLTTSKNNLVINGTKQKNDQVTRELGVPGMKHAMDLMGYYGGPCRRPLLPLGAEERKKLLDGFVASGFKPKSN